MTTTAPMTTLEDHLTARLKGKIVLLETYSAFSGPAITIGDATSAHRLAGPKITAGSEQQHVFTVDAAELLRELLAHAFNPNARFEDDE